MKKRILGHVVGITTLLAGTSIAHAAINRPEKSHIKLLDTEIGRTIVFDSGLLLTVVGFFIEFCLSFKPLKCKK